MALPTSYECSLHGLVPEHRQAALLDRLSSLCGGEDARQSLNQHVLGFVPKSQTPVGPARNDDVVLRLQSNIDESVDTAQRQWALCQYGHPDPHMSTVANTRPELYSAIHQGNALQFMDLLGYRYAFELVKEGYWFIYQSQFEITVSRVYELAEQHNLQSKRPKLADGSWLIEVAVHNVHQDQVKLVPDELVKFSTYLEGVAKLENVDYLYMQNKIYYT
ncbi:hypothetical protein H4R34_000020 [Dimargaris verticillata]|uniref:Mediator of RNA polymerase II transcription subunit 18 n=1 Tax=Dimargaris verticillata TaxID=2761393 RepID=A0A9W8EF16_9FUNG|nr:hypothetical protein H4R34_000020 [Dimargaris verticillata]